MPIYILILHCTEILKVMIIIPPHANIESSLVQALSAVIGMPPLQCGSPEEALRNYNICTEDEIRDAARFMRRCLQLDPEKRASARELLDDSWLKSG